MNRDSIDPRAAERYAKLDLDGDAAIIYDRTQTNAWIQSDVTVAADDATESESAVQRERHLAAANAERPFNGGGLD